MKFICIIFLVICCILPGCRKHKSKVNPVDPHDIYLSDDEDENKGGGEQPVPEPLTILLMGGGLAGLALKSRYQNRKKK